MSGNSNVGTSGVYEAGDQRNVKKSEMQNAERYNEGQQGSHIGLDSSMNPQIYGYYMAWPSVLTTASEDQRSIANRLAAEEVRCLILSLLYIRLTCQQQKSEPGDDRETALLKEDPTLPVSTHRQPQQQQQLTRWRPKCTAMNHQEEPRSTLRLQRMRKNT